MCDRNDTPGEDGSNLVYTRFKKKLTEANYKLNCKKCSINDGFVLLKNQDVYCGLCLEEYCTHKFRSTIGKSRLVKPGEKVLVAVSGGLSSIVLVDMIKRGLNEDIHRRLRFEPTLIHIDETILTQESDMIDLDVQNNFYQFIYDSGFKCYFTTLEKCLDEELDKTSSIVVGKSNDSLQSSLEKINNFITKSHTSSSGQKFLESFNSLHSYSSKHDFLTRLRYLIMVKLAQENGFDKVFVGTTSSELAVTLMSNISFGRGMEINSEMNFDDGRFLSVKLLRPMREFVSKEIAFYARYRKLNGLHFKPEITSTKKPIKSSIHRLMENFLTNLQQEFPSTVYTIYKTGNKITSTIDGVTNPDQWCKFCLGKLDTNRNDEYSAFDALQLTSALSTGLDSAGGSDQPPQSTPKSQEYCYSCLRLNQELTNNEQTLSQFCILKNR